MSTDRRQVNSDDETFRYQENRETFPFFERDFYDCSCMLTRVCVLLVPHAKLEAFPGDDVNNDQERTTHSIFSIEYYQRFFNVDAAIVWDRILSAIVPRRASINYLKHEIGLNPDLYGPFWIIVTLVSANIFRNLLLFGRIFLFNYKVSVVQLYRSSR